MSYSTSAEFYIRTFTPEDLQKAIKIAKEYAGIQLSTTCYDDGLAADTTHIYMDDALPLLSDLIYAIMAEVPNCLILYDVTGFESVVGMTDYYAGAKFPGEKEEICLWSHDLGEEEDYYDEEDDEYCEGTSGADYDEDDECYEETRNACFEKSLKSIKDVFSYIERTGAKVSERQAFDIFNIFEKGDVFDSRSENWGMENLVLTELPKIIPIEGTAYEGRNERIEKVEVGDRLILEADYDNEFYDPVAIEVLNDKKESLGYLVEKTDCELEDLAKVLNKVEASVESVTPLSARRKNAKYALLDVKIVLKEHEKNILNFTQCQKETSYGNSVAITGQFVNGGTVDLEVTGKRIDDIENQSDDELPRFEEIADIASNKKREAMQQRLLQLSEQRKQCAAKERDSEVKTYIQQLKTRAEKNYNKLITALEKRQNIMSQQSFESLLDPKLLKHFSLMEEDVQEYGNYIGRMVSEVMEKFLDVYEETSSTILYDMISTTEEAIDDVNDFRVDFEDVGGYLEYEWSETCGYELLKQNLQNMKQSLEQANDSQKWSSAQEEEYERLEYALNNDIAEEDVDKHKTYFAGCGRMGTAKTEAEYKEAVQLFKQIPGYLDADELKEKSEQAGKRAKELENAQRRYSAAQYKMETVKKSYDEQLLLASEQEKICNNLAEEVAKKRETCPEDKQSIEEKYGLEIARVNEKIQVCSGNIKCLSKEVAQASEELSELPFFSMGKKKELQSRIVTLNAQCDNEKQHSKLLENEKDNLIKNRESMLDKLAQEVAYAQRELGTANDWYAELKGKLENTEAELRDAKKQYEVAKKELETLDSFN